MMYNKEKGGIIMKKNLPTLVKLVLIIMLLAGAGMCVLWLPLAVSYLEGSCQWLSGKSHLIYGGFIAVAVPVFAVFFMAFAFVPAFESDSIFDKRMARLIKLIALIIGGDCLLFGILSGGIFCLGERMMSVLFIFIAMIGLTVSAMLLVLSDHVDRASELKEEVEGTL